MFQFIIIMSSYQIIFCSCPDNNTGNLIAKHLITKKLAACVNILPGIRSIYAWQGQVETTQEQLLLIKSRDDFYSKIEQEILILHPYELPEIIAVPITQIATNYLKWMDSCLLSS